MTIARFPLPLRNALAELAIASLEDEEAVAALRWLAAPSGPPAGAAAWRTARSAGVVAARLCGR